MGIETLVQGGAVGISIALIALLYRMWTSSSTHADKVVDVVEKNAVAMTSLTDAIEANTTVTKETKDLIANMNGKRKDN